MNIPKPVPKIFNIYTKSKCSYCTKAKENFPDANIINCDTYWKKTKENSWKPWTSCPGKNQERFL